MDVSSKLLQTSLRRQARELEKRLRKYFKEKSSDGLCRVWKKVFKMERMVNQLIFGAAGLAKETGAIPKATNRFTIG